MMFKKIAAAAALLAAAPAFAAIASGTSGNGELFLVVADSAAKVSYTLDLGVTQNDFFVVGQADAGYTRDWALNDAQFASFIGAAAEANLQWAVMANETTGGTAVGAQRTFSTFRVGTEALLGQWVNGLFSAGTATTQMGTFFTGVNTTGTHGTPGVPLNFGVNGSSFNRETDPNRGYFGEANGLTPSFNNNTPSGLVNINDVNVSSNFYYITRSGTDQLAPVLVDPFNNAAAMGKFTLQRDDTGRYNLDYTIPAVPEPGTYGLLLAGLAAVGFVARRRSR